MVEHVKPDRMRSFCRRETSQPPTASDHHQAATATRQQGADVISIARVIQQDEGPPPSEQASIQASLRLGIRRDPIRRYLKRLQKSSDRGICRDGIAAWAVTAEVHIQLAVRE